MSSYRERALRPRSLRSAGYQCGWSQIGESVLLNRRLVSPKVREERTWLNTLE
jgi:hypothetical protein